MAVVLWVVEGWVCEEACGRDELDLIHNAHSACCLDTVQVSEAGLWEEGVWVEFQLLGGVGEVEEDHFPEAPLVHLLPHCCY